MNRLSPSSALDAAARSLAIDGLLAGTQVRTLDGTLPVEYLSPGDRIITRTGTARLISMSSVMRKGAEVVLISASSPGYDRPEVDLFVGPDQRVMIRDWRAKVMFGTACAAIPARRMVDGEFVRFATLTEAWIFTLHFDAVEVIYAEGLELACERATIGA